MTTLLVLTRLQIGGPLTSAPLSSLFPSRSTPLPSGDKVQQPKNEQAEMADWIKEALLQLPPPLAPFRVRIQMDISPSTQLNEAQCLKGAEMPPWTCSVADIIIFIMRFYVAPDSSGEEPAELLKRALRGPGARLL